METFNFDGEVIGNSDRAQVGVIMGSGSDWPVMKYVCDALEQLQIPYERFVISAHRTPNRAIAYAQSASDRGIQVIIAGAGGAAHLAGVVAAKTILPVIGVPMKTSSLGGLDSLLSIVQMPRGVPVATVAIGNAGATNAGLLAAQIISLSDEGLRRRFITHRLNLSNAAASQRPWDT